jgi:precorrin-8X/cobalt-precorrin-8 methylmutase
MNYLRDPAAIYAESFAIIRSECDLSCLPADAHDIAVRIVHACGMPEIIPELLISPGFSAAAKGAIEESKPILVDAEMVRQGIMGKPLNIICTLNDPRAKAIGLSQSTTRSAAAVDLWVEHLQGSLAVIGNAPTALFRLLEVIEETGVRPAAIIGLPVGFVGAAESKQALGGTDHGIPFITLKGRKGGSAMAAAAVNALLRGTE